jgi:hypothetical protein
MWPCRAFPTSLSTPTPTASRARTWRAPWLGAGTGSDFAAGGVQLVAAPIDYSENLRVLVDELRANAAKNGWQVG